ncbi:response regulator [bacterium]|nr:response regulator [bacterium]
MNKRILIVDDDQLLRDVVGQYLTKNGFEVVIPNSALETIEIFNPGDYSLAIIDLVMPDIGGIELMESLLSKDPNLKVVIMTGYPTVDSAYKAMVDGVFEYIIKPFRMKELLEVAKKLIG